MSEEWLELLDAAEAILAGSNGDTTLREERLREAVDGVNARIGGNNG